MRTQRIVWDLTALDHGMGTGTACTLHVQVLARCQLVDLTGQAGQHDAL